MGALTIEIGITLVTAGTVYITAGEVSLLVLIESVLGPIWPWVFLDEPVTNYEVVGGTITLLTIMVFTVYGSNSKGRLVREGLRPVIIADVELRQVCFHRQRLLMLLLRGFG